MLVAPPSCPLSGTLLSNVLPLSMACFTDASNSFPVVPKHSLLLLLSCFSRVQFCVTPETAAHQAPPSLGFFRQEHWSGLPPPSPMCESEKWKWSCSVVSDSSWRHWLQATRLLRPWDFPGKSTGVGCHCLLHYLAIKTSLFLEEKYVKLCFQNLMQANFFIFLQK